MAPTRNGPLTLSSVTTIADPPFLGVTLHLTSRVTHLILASQKAPLYLAETSVPTAREAGSESKQPGESVPDGDEVCKGNNEIMSMAKLKQMRHKVAQARH